jgi:hypothetical protein
MELDTTNINASCSFLCRLDVFLLGMEINSQLEPQYVYFDRNRYWVALSSV